ncbi:MAG: tetratricopeptide repeat protein, partial [Gammaproteobacteria bacterium]
MKHLPPARIFLWVALIGYVAGTAAMAEGTPEGTAVTRIQALLEEGKFEEALTLTDGELERNGDDITLRFLRGLALTRLNRLDQAAATFSELTQEHPELPEPYNNLAVVYAAKGDYEKAREALQRAINTHPSYATAHENMGDIYAKMASQAYNQALELKEDSVSAKAKLALIDDLFSLPVSDQGVISGLGSGEVEAETAARLQPPAAATRTRETPGQSAPAPAVPEAVESQEIPVPDTADILRTVDLWAAAWSSKDVDAYLSFYAPEFAPEEGGPRSAWNETRKKRLLD